MPACLSGVSHALSSQLEIPPLLDGWMVGSISLPPLLLLHLIDTRGAGDGALEEAINWFEHDISFIK